MDSKVRSLTQALKAHDSALFAKRDDSTGMIIVWRKGTHWETYKLGESTLRVSIPSSYFILALTDNWTLGGTPRDWGILPVLQEIQDRDGYRYDNRSEDLEKAREKKRELKKRENDNNFRALAMDCRREFSKLTNDINTSSLDKVDNRRKRYGNY